MPLLTPQQALERIGAPAGFRTTLFAAEPDVQQPIAMAFDGRGRMWVAENYTYAESAKNHDLSLRDRIIILEDTDGDGRAEKRSVFWDQAKRLTSIELGFGGVWAMCPPHLLFIPDRDGDDRPDGEPVVMLDGWDDGGSRHNFTNGLRWGPDGWLYGRNGILVTSRVGVPGAAAHERVPMNCGIWRFHPQRRTFEVVCHGTTNPWGMDWDEHGQLFFINTVIGHLWHAIPGAHYRHMYGEDLNPRLYELIEQTADHFHWDAGAEDWTSQRTKLSESTSRAGGGHAHSGLMIYLGDNWPKEYRGEMFTVNFHGRRLNRDHIERAGATYVGRHRPDFLTTSDPWFRGIDLAYGPDGGVFLLDWSDIGECHENDGVHRTSGRIYKVTWSPPGAKRLDRATPIDVAKLRSRELVKLQRHENEWFVRQARRALHERIADGHQLRHARDDLWKLVRDDRNVVVKLRALWCLHTTGGIEESRLVELMQHDNEHVRLWAVRFLVDDARVTPAGLAALTALAKHEPSGLVLTFLASALQRLTHADRFPIAASLAAHDEFAGDRVLPLMIWYGVEAAVEAHPDEAVNLIARSNMPRVTRYIARRLTAAIESQPAGVNALVAMLREEKHAARRADVLQGMAEALRGWRKAPAPAAWGELASMLDRDSSAKIKGLARELSVVFGDGRAIDDVKRLAVDAGQPLDERRQAIRSLAAARVEGLDVLLKPLLADRNLADEAVRGLAAVNLAAHAPLLIAAYKQMPQPGKEAAIESLATRADAASQLLDAVEQGTIGRGEVSPVVLRQMQFLSDERLNQRIARLWPETRLIAGDKLKLMAQYRAALDNEMGRKGGQLRTADLAKGRAVFDQACAKCHRLFGQGGAIGPDLTGAQRTNLNYWLENIVDPSATLAESFRMSVVRLDDGRVVSGVVTEQNERTITVQTPTERQVVERQTIEQIKPSNLSLMPDGLLAPLTPGQIRDLVAYLMSPRQVAPPLTPRPAP